MRYIIIGAGAVGGTIGGCLALAGHEVVLTARGAHLEALRDGGLRLRTPQGTHVVRVPAIGGPDEIDLRPGDVLIVATKSQDTVGVLGQWAGRPVAASGAAAGGVACTDLPVICAQNGVANERFALRRFRRVYGMCVWLPATHVAPGEVAAHGQPMAGLLWVGRYPGGTDETIERVAADLEASRLLAPVSEDVMRWKYRKLLGNLGNAIEALTGALGPGRNDGPAGKLMSLAAAEGTAVLDAAGIGYATAEETRAARGRQVDLGEIPGVPRGGGSSWQSLTRGTGSIEADFLNGEIVLLGREHGIPTPVNEALQLLANRAAADRLPPGSLTPEEVLAAAEGARGNEP